MALRTIKDGDYEATLRRVRRAGRRLAAGLAALGVGRGDTVGFMLTNRPEFHLIDTAAMHLGATPFSIYNTSSPEQIEYLVADAGNRVIVTSGSSSTGCSRPRERGRDARARGRASTARRPRGRSRSSELEALGAAGLRLRGGLARGRARRRADADLHLGHDRAAEGRAADPRQHARRVPRRLRRGRAGRAGRAGRSPSCRSAHIADRWAQSLRADGLRRHACTAAPTRARWSPTSTERAARRSGAACRGSGRSSKAALETAIAAEPTPSKREATRVGDGDRPPLGRRLQAAARPIPPSSRPNGTRPTRRSSAAIRADARPRPRSSGS